MSVYESYRRGRHSVTRLVVHLVFTTKYRRKVFDGYMIGQLREAFESACEKLDCRILEFDGEAMIVVYGEAFDAIGHARQIIADGAVESVGLYVREAVDVALVSQFFLGHKHLANRGDLVSRADTLAVQILDGASAYRIQPPARSALNRAVTALSDARVEIAHRRFSPGFVKAERCYDTIFSYEIARELVRDRDRLPDAMGEEARGRIDHGRQVGASSFQLSRRDAIGMRSELLDQL